MIRLRLYFLALSMLLLPTFPLYGQTAPPASIDNLENYWILIEPKFLQPDLTMKIKGARKTFFVPGREISEYPGIRAYSREEFQKLRISEASFYSKASEAAARLLDTITPKLIKDSDGTIKYAVIHLERPIVSGLVIARNFPQKFSHLFGDRMLVFIPERYILFVFPENKNTYENYLNSMATRFNDATFACSREIFFWEKGTDRPVIIGSFSD